MPWWGRWRIPGTADLVASAVLTATVQTEVWLAADTSGRPIVATSFAVGTLAAAWHRIAPMTALAVAFTGLFVIPSLLGFTHASDFAWLVAVLGMMASAGFHARRPLLALVTGLALASLGVGLSTGWIVGDLAFAWLLLSGAWLAGRAVANRALREEMAEQRARHVEQQAQWRAAAAVAEERLRIAREMHDVVAHSLSVMTLHAGGVRRLLRPEQERERAALEAVERTGRESLAEMHRMLGVLRGPGTADAAPAPGLGRLPELLEPLRTAGLRVDLTVSGDVRPFPPGLEQAAYRIVQEAVTNVLRHAGATRLACTVHHAAATMEITVVDDGAGSGPVSTGGHGLVGMRERAAAYGGTLSAGPLLEGGFAVHAVLPTSGADAAAAPMGGKTS